MKITLNLEEVKDSLAENTISDYNVSSPGKSDLKLVNQEYYARPQNDESEVQTIPRNHEDVQMIDD
jgi:hypothetical protein